MANYIGDVIEESLENKEILKKLKITKTEVEIVTERHKTPWLKVWTVHAVEVPEKEAKKTAQEISHCLDAKHDWYADFKNERYHYIIFKNKVFFIDRRSKKQYDGARNYGISLGIPEYQVNFHPDVKNGAK